MYKHQLSWQVHFQPLLPDSSVVYCTSVVPTHKFKKAMHTRKDVEALMVLLIFLPKDMKLYHSCA